MTGESGQATRDVGRTNPETLTSWILHQQHIQAPTARGNLTILLNSICVACKFVQSAVRKAGLAGILGLAGSANVQGEDQKKLDILANEVFVNVLRKSGQCFALISEEDDEPTIISGEDRGEYGVVFDPLDGSSNIDCGVSIGTIFGVYKRTDGTDGCVEDVLRPGREMVAAGYCLYGSSCAMVISIGEKPSVFTLDPSLGEFVLTNAEVTVPPRGTIYSVNEGNAALWDEPTSSYVQQCKFPNNGKAKSARYVGSMVADVHRTLLYGGIFLYPADSKNARGKLRLLYEGFHRNRHSQSFRVLAVEECIAFLPDVTGIETNEDLQVFPMAYIMEHAGGRSISGAKLESLDIQPTGIHERCPIFLGSKKDVDDVEKLILAAGKSFQLS